MSAAQVCGFMATIRSTPPRRPRWPASVTRTSYQVGRPWMFDGKMLRGLTGTPMRRRLRANSSFADADPEPLTLANLMTKSLTASIRGAVPACTFDVISVSAQPPGGHRRPLGGQRSVGASCQCGHFLGGVVAATAAARARLRDGEFLHVPGARRAALGAQAAVQADVFVLDHDAAGLESARHVQVLRQVERRRL